MPVPAVLLVLLAGCAPEGAWLVGTWEIASWSVVVGDASAPLLEATVADAGTLTFSDPESWWVSNLLYEGPDVMPDGAGGYVVIEQAAWTRWTEEEGEIWLAWGQDFSTPEVMIPDTRKGETFEAVSTYEFELLATSVPVVTDWSLVRRDP